MASLEIVPTPIGNLNDITFRAIETLKSVDIILAEDTRQTGKLLKHFDIKTPMKSFHQYNEHKMLSHFIERMKNGENLALVSDAGTPGISDPGFLIVRECVKEGIAVSCLPGATAFVPALVCSGFPCERFVFEGFLPHKKGRKTRLNELKEETKTMVLYESPYRVIKTLQQLSEVLGEDRKGSVSREISKIYEETIRGSLAELNIHFNEHPPKGEFVIVVEGRK